MFFFSSSTILLLNWIWSFFSAFLNFSSTPVLILSKVLSRASFEIFTVMIWSAMLYFSLRRSASWCWPFDSYESAISFHFSSNCSVEYVSALFWDSSTASTSSDFSLAIFSSFSLFFAEAKSVGIPIVLDLVVLRIGGLDVGAIFSSVDSFCALGSGWMTFSSLETEDTGLGSILALASLEGWETSSDFARFFFLMSHLECSLKPWK